VYEEYVAAVSQGKYSVTVYPQYKFGTSDTYEGVIINKTNSVFEFLTPTIAGLIMVAGAVPPLVAVYWLREERHKPAVLWFQCLMGCAMAWSLLFGLLALIEIPQIRFGITNLLMLVIPSSAVCYFLFCYEFTFKRSAPKAVFVLFVPVGLLFVFSWTNPYGLIYTIENPHLTTEILIPASEGSIRPLVNVGMAYLLVILGSGMVLGELFTTSQPARKMQTGIILLSSTVSGTFGMIKILDLVPAFFDPTPIGWALSGLLFAVAVRRYQFLHVLPAAQDQVIDEITDCIFVLAPDGRVIDANAAAVTTFEVEIGMTNDELTHRNPELSQLVGQPRGNTFEIERGGTTTVFDASYSTFTQGDSDGIEVVVLRDITDQKHAEQALEQTKERYQRMLKRSSDYVTIIDKTETIVDVTQGVEHVLGYQPDEMIGTKVLPYIHPDDRRNAFETFVQTLKEPETELRIEYRAQTADGDYCWIEGRGRNHFDDPLIGGMLVNVRDITDRKQAEQTIADTKEYYRRVLEQSLDYTLVIDESNTITEVTPGVEAMSGFRPDEVVGQNAFEAVHPDERDRVRDSFDAAIEDPGAMINIEYRVLLRDGSYNWVEARGKSHFDDPHLDGIVINVRDISERKQREQELAETAARLAQKNEQLERLAQIVSHDLQTPLSTAEKLTRLLRADLGETETEPEIEQSIQDLEATHERLRAFADHLPRLARESTDVEGPIDCELDGVAKAAWSMVDTDGLRLRIESTCRLQADPDRLQRVFENLFQNTVTHATPPATTVRVGTVEDGFYIEDDGPGIRPEQRTELFEYGMGTEGGSGLGLAIVRTTVEAHGWSITLAEQATEGTRFEIRTES